MKRLLTVFALITLCSAIVVLTAVQGQDSDANKFRRAPADKKIHDQYIVVLNLHLTLAHRLPLLLLRSLTAPRSIRSPILVRGRQTGCFIRC